MIGTSECARRSRHVQPVDIRQAEIEQDEVGLPGRESLRPCCRALDDEALAAQTVGERVSDRVLVLDEQDPHARIVAELRRFGIGTFPNLGAGFLNPGDPLARSLHRGSYLRVHQLRRFAMPAPRN